MISEIFLSRETRDVIAKWQNWWNLTQIETWHATIIKGKRNTTHMKQQQHIHTIVCFDVVHISGSIWIGCLGGWVCVSLADWLTGWLASWLMRHFWATQRKISIWINWKFCCSALISSVKVIETSRTDLSLARCLCIETQKVAFTFSAKITIKISENHIFCNNP